eukprot:403370418
MESKRSNPNLISENQQNSNLPAKSLKVHFQEEIIQNQANHQSRIQVSVRIKPLNQAEKMQEKNCIWQVQQDGQTLINKHTNESYLFDNVFNEDMSNQEIFDQDSKQKILSALEGYNVTIFAYGQTCSGKTFTMRGSDENFGVIPQTLAEIFQSIDEARLKPQNTTHSQTEFSIKVSYLEIYNEVVNDLLDPQKKNLDIRECKLRGIYIDQLSQFEVNSFEDCMKYLHKGDEFKIIAETNQNELSSRSHTILKIEITQKFQDKNSGNTKIKTSEINLVDLAGSECVSKTNSQGLRLREGANINKSLLALSNVICQLSQKNKRQSQKNFYINYRDSKLTRILQQFLSGNSQTSIICTISQLFDNYSESKETLNFGAKAKNIKTSVTVNEIVQDQKSLQEVDQINFEFKLQKQEQFIERLKSQIQLLEQNLKEVQNTSIANEKRIRERNLLILNLQSKVEILEKHNTSLQRDFEDTIQNRSVIHNSSGLDIIDELNQSNSMLMERALPSQRPSIHNQNDQSSFEIHQNPQFNNTVPQQLIETQQRLQQQEIQCKLDVLTEQYKQLEVEKEDLLSHFEEAERSMEDLVFQIRELDNKCNECQEECNSMGEELETLQHRYQDQRKQLENYQSTCNDQKRDIQSLTQKLADQVSETDLKDKEIENLKLQLTALRVSKKRGRELISQTQPDQEDNGFSAEANDCPVLEDMNQAKRFRPNDVYQQDAIANPQPASQFISGSVGHPPKRVKTYTYQQRKEALKANATERLTTRSTRVAKKTNQQNQDNN